MAEIRNEKAAESEGNEMAISQACGSSSVVMETSQPLSGIAETDGSIEEFDGHCSNCKKRKRLSEEHKGDVETSEGNEMVILQGCGSSEVMETSQPLSGIAETDGTIEEFDCHRSICKKQKRLSKEHKREVETSEGNEMAISQACGSSSEVMETSQPLSGIVETDGTIEELDGHSSNCRKRKRLSKEHKRDVETTENKPVIDWDECSHTKKKFLKSNFDAFGKCVSSQLNFLPLQQAIVTQERIQGILKDELLKTFTCKNPD